MPRPAKGDALIARVYELLVDGDEEEGLAFAAANGVRCVDPDKEARGHPNNLEGQRFGKLVVETPLYFAIGKRRDRWWLCTCDCGEAAYVRSAGLRSGNTRSCGRCAAP